MIGSSKPPLHRRRLLERPRLTRALDGSQARVRMLVAGPGFGKTILTEEWAAGGQRVAWIRSRRSSADVAVLARQMAAAGAEILPGCDRRLCERLNATADPAGEIAVLVDLLSEDFAGWPDDAWIVIDDYQHIRESAAAEAFVEGIVQQSPVQVIISTRDRPSWVTTRSILYGDVFELDQSTLAMTDDEVSEMLAGVHDELSPSLLTLAAGWPAVIGMASLTTSALPIPEENLDLPEQLYAFFAEEVYRNLEPDVSDGLGLLATAPSLDRELAIELLGPERAERVCRAAITLGVLAERGGKLELHPLGAAFLEQRARREGRGEADAAVARCLEVYRSRREWDAAFELVDRYGTTRFEGLLEEALDDLLNSARLTTITAWTERAVRGGLDLPLMEVATAEVNLRHGLHTSAESAGRRVSLRSAANVDVRFRALEVAARAAHVGSREEAALELYQRASQIAPDEYRRRKAMWGQIMCAGSLELPEAHELMRELEASSDEWEPAELVRLVDKQLSLGFRFGYVRHLGEARRVSELVPTVADPFIRCSFLSMYSWALTLGCFYQEANEQAARLLHDATEYRVDVAISHGQAMLGYSFAGLREFHDAEESLRNAAESARSFNDPFAEHNAYALTVRVLLQQGRAAEACAIEPPGATDSVKSMRGELLASRALALATLGRLNEALEVGREAILLTQGIETRLLWSGIRTIVALKSRDSGLVGCAEEFVSLAFETEAVDLLVCVYRSNPELLATLLASSVCAERTIFALSRAGDHHIAREMGLEVLGSLDLRSKLSTREREVYDHLCAGLSNREIAQRLFISEATVKLHAHHVYDKVGIRSRTALAINAVHERVRQATRTIDIDDPTGIPR